MKRILFILAVIMTLSLTSCYKNANMYIGEYLVYFEDHGDCEMFVLQPFYSDDEYSYAYGYGGCSGGEYYFIKDSGEFVDLETALERELITIEQVISSGIDVHRKDLNDENSTYERI